MKNAVKSEDAAVYAATAQKKTEEDDAIILRAIEILTRRLERTEAWSADALTSPEATVNLLRLRVAALPYEVFGCLFLDNRHRMIYAQELFRGTIDGASAHPREVVREAIAANAAAVVLYHNHPSEVAEPSQADIRITKRMKEALALVDVRVLDHIIVGGTTEYASFAERGIL